MPHGVVALTLVKEQVVALTWVVNVEGVMKPYSRVHVKAPVFDHVAVTVVPVWVTERFSGLIVAPDEV